jgi:hypothetical protein
VDGSTHAIELKDLVLQSVSWSADNQRLYVSALSELYWNIYSITLDGKFEKLLEDVPPVPVWLVGPKPSPDGHYLAYFQRSYEQNAIMLENY